MKYIGEKYEERAHEKIRIEKCSENIILVEGHAVLEQSQTFDLVLFNVHATAPEDRLLTYRP